MIVHEIELKNFCQHRHRLIELHHGLNGFVGPNGSGKSSALAAVLGALVGDFTRTHGVKNENICQAAEPGEKSFVRLVVSHGEARGTVTRYLQGGKTVLNVDGDPHTVRGDKAVTQRIIEWLEIDEVLLKQYLFIAQGEMLEPFSATPAQRARTLQKLFGTEHAERCWEAVGDWLSRQELEAPLDLDDLRRQLLEKQQTADELRNEGLQIDESRIRSDLRLAQRVFDDYQQQERVDRELREADSSARRAEQRLREAQEAAEEIAEDIQTLQQAIDGNAAAAHQAQQRLPLLEHAARQREAARQRDRRVRELEQELQSLREPQNPAPDVDFENIDQQLNTLRDKILRYSEFCRVFSQDGIAECPTCGTPMSNLQEKYEQYQRDLPRVQQEEQELTRRIEAALQYDVDHDAWERRRRELRSQIDLLNDQTFELASTPEEDPQELQQIVEQQQKWTIALYGGNGKPGLLQEQHAASQEVAAAQASLDEARDRRRRAQEQAPVRAVTREQLREAEQLQQDGQHKQQRLYALQGRLAEVLTRIRELEQEIQRAEARRRALEAKRSLVDDMRVARSVLHRDNLPRDLAMSNLALLQEQINEILQEFGVDYRVFATEDLSFTASFDDGRVQPAPRLSYGQKVLLALALYIAINSRFASGIGFLALDEPTNFLDRDNLRCLDQALDRLRQVSESRGLQSIIITHQTELGHLFDRRENFP